MQTKFNYTSGGEFTKTDGSSYIGYFNVNDKEEVYTGRYFSETSEILNFVRYVSETSEILNSVSVYSSDYYTSTNFKDRNVFDVLSLPFSSEEIVIQPSEIVSFSVLNKKIEYLHDNLIYLYSQLYTGSTDVPVDKDVNTLCNLIGTNQFGWETRAKQVENNRIFGFGSLSAVPALSSYREFDVMKRFVVIPFENIQGIGIFAISNTYFIGLTSTISDDGQLSNAAFTFYTNVIDNDTNETCKNLEDIKYDGKFLFVSDSKINGGGQVFKYDITGYLTNDHVFENKKYMIEPIGGSGSVERLNKFRNCTVLGANNGEVWVYDSGNNVIKIYDNNFVHKRVIKIPKTRNYSVLDIR